MWDSDIVADDKTGAFSEPNQQVDSNKKPVLVIDTNAFIKCLDLQSLHDKYDLYTTAEVKMEIRDKKARDKFLTLPFEINVKDPSKTALAAVRKFAIATGDIASLSDVDLRVIALCYTFAELNNTADLIRKDPPEFKEAFAPKEQVEEDEEETAQDTTEESAQKPAATEDDEWTVVPTKEKKKSNKQGEDGFGSGWNYVDKKVPVKTSAKVEIPTEPVIEVAQQVERSESASKDQETTPAATAAAEAAESSEEDDDDDGVGWINGDNLHLYKDQGSSKKEIQEIKLGVSIMTADYAMQNVSLQMGIPLVSIDGMLITRAKRFILECFACLTIVVDMTKRFCPRCGNHSLLKVSCSFQANGEIKLYRKKGFKINTQGFIYSIPKPKIGKHANNLLLKEDQLLQGNKLTQMKIAQKQQEKEFSRNMLEFENGFGLGDVKHKMHVNHNLQFGYGNINPNNVSQTKRYKRN